MRKFGFSPTPIKIDVLENLFKSYPNKHDSNILVEGFKYGFQLNYTGPRLPQEYKNLLSVDQNITKAIIKLPNEINLGRMAVPFIINLYPI